MATYGDHTVWAAMQGNSPGCMAEIPSASVSASVEDSLTKVEPDKLVEKPVEKPLDKSVQELLTVDPVSSCPFKTPEEMFKAAQKQDEDWKEFQKKERSKESNAKQSKEPDLVRKPTLETNVEKGAVKAKKMPRPPSYPPVSTTLLG